MTNQSTVRMRRENVDDHDDDDGKTAGGSTANLTTDKVKELDAVIGSFSDVPGPCPTGNLWKQWRQQQVEAAAAAAAAAERVIDNDEPSIAAIVQHYAPLHRQTQFEDLYRVLHPALVDRRREKKNASAFLQGARGSGKSFVLERCLEALVDQVEAAAQHCSAATTINDDNTNKLSRSFRIVRLNGILVPGSQVSLCVQEILRQLTELAFQENHHEHSAPSIHHQNDHAATSVSAVTLPDPNDTNQDSWTPPKKKRRRSQRTKELLRLRKTSFTNQIQLLNEILQFACLDGIPILFVLDELDAFVKGAENFMTATVVNNAESSMDRQLLLYHLLDRVATDSSLVSFVGLTCHNGTMSLLEKRIRSRAEGTTRFIYFGPSPSWTEWSDIIEDKLLQGTGNPSSVLYDEWKQLVTSSSPNEAVQAEKQQIQDCLHRSCHLGYSIRWLFRVISSSFLLYRHKLLLHNASQKVEENNTKEVPSLQSCLMQSLAAMEAPFLSPSSERHLILVDKVAVNNRVQALRDLSGPQLVLVLAARRILVRDSHRENSVPLTLDRMLEEYKSYKGNSNQYSRAILWTSFRDMLDTGLFRPGTDHAGMAPLQYNLDGSFLDLTAPTAGKIPLHLTVDIHRELQKAMDQKLLDCSAALQEWGKKTT